MAVRSDCRLTLNPAIAVHCCRRVAFGPRCDDVLWCRRRSGDRKRCVDDSTKYCRAASTAATAAAASDSRRRRYELQQQWNQQLHRRQLHRAAAAAFSPVIIFTRTTSSHSFHSRLATRSAADREQSATAARKSVSVSHTQITYRIRVLCSGARSSLFFQLSADCFSVFCVCAILFSVFCGWCCIATAS